MWVNSTQKGRIQRSLEPIFKTAETWELLIHRLNRCGYVLRPMGRGLAIYINGEGTHVCNTATVGYRYRALVKRFGCPMPGHPHGADWVKSGVNRTAAAPDGVEPDFDVIERLRPTPRRLNLS